MDEITERLMRAATEQSKQLEKQNALVEQQRELIEKQAALLRLVFGLAKDGSDDGRIETYATVSSQLTGLLDRYEKLQTQFHELSKT